MNDFFFFWYPQVCPAGEKSIDLLHSSVRLALDFQKKSCFYPNAPVLDSSAVARTLFQLFAETGAKPDFFFCLRSRWKPEPPRHCSPSTSDLSKTSVILSNKIGSEERKAVPISNFPKPSFILTLGFYIRALIVIRDQFPGLPFVRFVLTASSSPKPTATK